MTRSYVARILRRASLAPGIVWRFWPAREPNGLSLETLVKGMSISWVEQRPQLVFAPKR